MKVDVVSHRDYQGRVTIAGKPASGKPLATWGGPLLGPSEGLEVDVGPLWGGVTMVRVVVDTCERGSPGTFYEKLCGT